MVPADAEYHIYCNSPEKGAAKRKVCKAGCIGCGKCERLFNGNFQLNGSLAQVNYDSADALNCEMAEAVNCPVGCLLQVEERLNAAYRKLEGKDENE